MKKYIVSLFMVLALGMNVYAQDARQRTVETIVQDVLAVLPADNLEECYVQMADLAGAAPVSVTYLAKMMEPSDKGVNNILEYAISGVVRYATDPANASVKDAVKDGLMKAIKSCHDKYNRQFLEAQLRLMQPYAPAVQEFPKDYNPVDEAKAMIKSPDGKERCKALWIYSDNLGEKSAKVMLNALKSDDRAVRTTALLASESFAGEAFYAKVAKMYKKMPADSRYDVIAWFGENKVTSQLPLVLSAIKEGGEVGKVAVEAAGRIGGEQAAEALMNLIGRSQLSDDALAALKYVDVDLTDMILTELPHSRGERLKNLLHLASLRRIGEIAPSVLDYASSSDSQIAESAASALEGVVSSSDFEAVARLLDGESAYLSQYEEALQASLKGMSSDECFRVLSDFTAKASNPERFYGVMAEAGTDEAVDYLISAYENGSMVALESLSSVNNMKAAPVLLAASDKNQKYLKRFVDIVEANVTDNGEKIIEYYKALGKASDNDAVDHILKALGNVPTMNAYTLAAKYLDDPALAYTAAGAVKNIASRNPQGIDYYALKSGLEKAAAIYSKAGGADDGYAVDEIKKMLNNLKPFDKYQLTDEEKKLGFEVLYDGTDLSKWTGDKVGYTSVNGCIEVTAGYGAAKNLYTIEEYTDFILRFEFCFTRSGVNNGVGIRTPMGVDAAYHGMCEVQVLDHDAPIYEGLREYQVHGSVYGIVPAKRIVHKPLGEWSTEEIRVVGDRITVTVNGEVILDADIRKACQGHNVAPDGSENNPYTVDGRNHPGMFNKKGHVGFLGHGEGLKYRNVRILDLSAGK